jgi:gliding motility-associated-like protein
VLTPINACLNPPDTMMVTFTPAPVINAGSDQSICNGGAISLNASMNSVPSGMMWTTNGTGSFSPNDSSLAVTYLPSAGDAALDTLYFYTATTGNGMCFAAMDTVLVLLGNTPVAAFTSAGNCSGQSASFTDASTVSAGSVTAWSWDFGDGNTSAVQNPANIYTTPGTYVVTLVAYAGAGCTDTVTQNIVINPLPSAAFTYVSNCSSDTVAFTDNSTITSGSISSWSWDFGDLGTSVLQDPSHVYGIVDTFTVVLNVTSDSGCVASVTQNIIVTPRPDAGFVYVVDCATGMVTVSDTSAVMAGDSIVSWSWNFGNGNTSGVQNPAPQNYVPGTYTVQLQITTSAGCTATDTATVTILAPPVADFLPAGGSYQVGQTISFTDQSVNTSAWYWDFGNNSDTSIVQNPSYSYGQNGTYTVTLVASNGGCSDTAAYQFEITGSPIIAPTAFSPNGDNLNDVFRIGGGPFKSYELRVFNEWGQQIFFSDDQANGWNGTYKDKDQPAGPYVYIFIGTTYKDEEVKLQGEIAITR